MNIEFLVEKYSLLKRYSLNIPTYLSFSLSLPCLSHIHTIHMSNISSDVMCCVFRLLRIAVIVNCHCVHSWSRSVSVFVYDIEFKVVSSAFEILLAIIFAIGPST